MDEFWAGQAVESSWRLLQELRKDFTFTLIGGWAVFLWTKALKSKNIDFIADFKTIEGLRNRFPSLSKNERLRKYEIKLQDFDVDVYAPFYSKLALPAEEVISKYSAESEGFALAKPEALLVLKQGAYADRKNSAKGRKDAIDILSLCLNAGIDWKAYEQILEEHGKRAYAMELARLIGSFSKDDLHYLSVGFQEFNKWKKKTIPRLKAMG